MYQREKQPSLYPLLLVILLMGVFWLSSHQPTQAQIAPTPIQINLTPTLANQATATPSQPSDPFEPNNTASTASPIPPQASYTNLTLCPDDEDWFQLTLKVGESIQIDATAPPAVDPTLTLLTADGLTPLAHNDDLTTGNRNAQLIFVAPHNGRYLLQIRNNLNGCDPYTLNLTLVQPTVTTTPLPSNTPTPTATPRATPTPLVPSDIAEPNNLATNAFPIIPNANPLNLAVGANDPVDHFTFIARPDITYQCATASQQVDTLLEVWDSEGNLLTVNDDKSPHDLTSAVQFSLTAEETITLKLTSRGGTFGAYTLACSTQQNSSSSSATSTGTSTGSVTNSVSNSADTSLIFPTATITATPSTITPLTITPLTTADTTPTETRYTTTLNMLIYYDQDNDKEPSYGEGVAGVSVVIVSREGQIIARAFTDADGRLNLTLQDPDIYRVVIPFVSGWSQRLQVGDTNTLQAIGLPASRIPTFFPVNLDLLLEES